MSGRTSDTSPVTSAIGVENPCPRRKSNRYVLALNSIQDLEEVICILLQSQGLPAGAFIVIRILLIWNEDVGSAET